MLLVDVGVIDVLELVEDVAGPLVEVVVGTVDVELVVASVEVELVVGMVEGGMLVVDDVDVELVVARHGSGMHAPGPTSMPPSVAHAAADSSTQVKAPPGEPRQHRVGGALVEVLLVVGVVVVLLVGLVDVELLV